MALFLIDHVTEYWSLIRVPIYGIIVDAPSLDFEVLFYVQLFQISAYIVMYNLYLIWNN